MKPASLQDAIKASALQKQKRIESEGWKEPVIKTHKVTAVDISMRITPPPALSSTGNSSSSSFGNNHETMAMKRQMEDLKREMRDLKSDMKQQQQSCSSLDFSVVEEQKDADDNINDDVRAELQTLREQLKEAEIGKLLPRMKKLYVQVKELDSQMVEMKASSTSSSSSNRKNTVDHSAELKILHTKIAQDYAKLQKQKADASELEAVLKFCSDQDNAIKQHLNEIIEQGEIIQKQQQTIQQQNEAIAENQREIEQLKWLVRDVAHTAQVAREMAEKAQKDAHQLSKAMEEVDKRKESSNSLGGSLHKESSSSLSGSLQKESSSSLSGSLQKESSRGPGGSLQKEGSIASLGGLIAMDDDDDELQGKSASDKMPTTAPTRGRSRSTNNLYAADNSDDDDSEKGEKTKQRDIRRPSRSRSRHRLLAKTKLDGISDSCAKFEADAAFLFHSKSERKIVSQDSPPSPSHKQKTLLAPVSPLTSEDDDLCFSSSKHKPNKSMSDLVVPDLKSSSSSDCDSSDHGETKRKKTINLMPHRSEKLYEEQRKDSVLRRFMTNKKTPNMSVRTVHGCNLVFFSDRIYIPSSMRDQTMDYYKKKYRYSPISALERNCFWPDMKTDMRNYNPPETRWRVCDAVNEV